MSDARQDRHETRHDMDDMVEAQRDQADAVTRTEVTDLARAVASLKRSVDNLQSALRHERKVLRRRGAIATTLLTIWAAIPAAVVVVVLWQAAEHRGEIVGEAIYATCVQQKQLERAAIEVVESARTPRSGEDPSEHAERMRRIDEAVALLESPPCDDLALP